MISGSVLSGRTAAGEVFGYLGRYHHQISVIPEGRTQEFLGWLSPGADKFSTVNTFVSKLLFSSFDVAGQQLRHVLTMIEKEG